jgi:uncharacterized protein Usg
MNSAAGLLSERNNLRRASDAMSDLHLQLRSYRLTTAEILYHMPDHPSVLQSFIWQQLDMAPEFPVLHRFLDFWTHNLEGKLHSVKVAHADLVTPGKLVHARASLQLH